MPRKLKNPSKGFKRSKKEWEQSIAGHIGKLIDRLKIDDVLTLGLGGWGAYTFKEAGLQSMFWAALYTMLGYKLARVEGGGGTFIPSPSQLAGLAILSAMGFSSLNLGAMLSETFRMPTQKEAMKTLIEERGYTPEQVEAMKNLGSQIGEEFHPFG